MYHRYWQRLTNNATCPAYFLWYGFSMTAEVPRGRGRPPTGVTPKRNIRLGEVWERGEELAALLGITMTAYVEDALRRANERVGRQLARRGDRPSSDPPEPGPAPRTGRRTR